MTLAEGWRPGRRLLVTMPASHPFRFGITAAQAVSAEGWKATARQAEAAGYSTLLIADWIGPLLSPMPALAVAGASTDRLHVGTWVLANDFRNPVLVAREAATLDLLTEGRFELGLGAGRTDNGYTSLGIQPESGGVRVRRLAESVHVIKTLLRGETATVKGEHYTVAAAPVYPPVRHQVPILLAAGGRKSIELAGREADIVAVGGAWSADVLSEQLGWMRAAAGERFPEIELGMRFWVLPEGDARAWQAAAAIMKSFGTDPEALIAAGAPSVLTGSPAAMVEQLEARREAFGLSYVVVDGVSVDAFAPAVAGLAGR
jgi:probable F420-dependent oxidoreductase